MCLKYKPYMTQIRDDSTFTSNGVTKKLKYIDHNFFAFEARDLNSGKQKVPTVLFDFVLKA